MQRYFIPSENWMDDIVYIQEGDAHHISHVMRMNEGEKIICNHPEGQAAVCEITIINPDVIEAQIAYYLDENKENPVSVTIAQGLPKGDKLDLILQKGTELGAKAFIPYQAERSIVQWNDKKFAKKKQRFEKIIKEASEQSHRTILPKISSVMTLNDLIDESNQYDVKLFAYEEEAKGKKHHLLSETFNMIKPNQKLLICIGPEGGFSKKEVEVFYEQEFIPIRIGPRILRTETAAMYILSCLSYHFEEF